MHIHLNHKKKLLIIQSLWPFAILHAFSSINELFSETIKVQKKVPVSVAQLCFLREKRTSELDNDAFQVSMGYPEARILQHKESDDLVYISVSGLRHFVESTAESINEMLNGFQCTEEELQVDSKYKWTREWREATKLAIEAECDVVVDFPTHDSPSRSVDKGGAVHSETCTIAIRFSYVHERALKEARDVVTECITLSAHSVEVDRSQQEEILKALKNKKLTSLGTLTSLQLNKAEEVVHIISPQRFPNGVEEMGERLMRYINKDVSRSTEVELEPPLSVLIQNRHFKDLKKDKSVFFKFTPCGVSLSGKIADVEAAKEKLKGLVAELEASMCTQSVAVPKWLQFAISTKEVRSVLNRCEKTHAVQIVILEDISSIHNELMWEAEVHPEGWSKSCTVQLVLGSLIEENTDAIVNVADENLKLMDGLAGSILKAGGPVIQDECTKYTDVNGPVGVGHAVCLGSGNLPCKKVVHAVGPRWQGGNTAEDHMLKITYLASMKAAVESGCRSISFPAIGAGLFSFPVDRCALSAVNALTLFIAVHPDTLSTVKFVLLQEADVQPFQEAFQSLLSNQSFNATVTQGYSISHTTNVKSAAVWMWEDDSGVYQCFTDDLSTQLEQQFAVNSSGLFQLKRGYWSYTVNLATMTQTRNATGKVRRLRHDALSSSSMEIFVKGCRKDVNSAVRQIQTHIKGMRGSEVLQFSKRFAPKMERCLQDVCTRFHVHVDFSDVGSQTRETYLIGWKVSVSKVVKEGRKTLIELLQAGSAEEVSRPPEWDLNDSPVSLKEVSPISIEFSKVLSLMQHTLPNVRITKLERIQNEWLWTRYSQHRELIKKKNQGTAQELDLFHGTRSNLPHYIYTGEEGFDMRFSAQGMWGTGNYFAENASYSHAYAYSMGGSRQVFLVKVLVGASFECHANPSLRMPPEKPSRTSSLFGVERYDSVSGVTNGSKVYIIYDNLKAYPFYLITYTA